MVVVCDDGVVLGGDAVISVQLEEFGTLSVSICDTKSSVKCNPEILAFILLLSRLAVGRLDGVDSVWDHMVEN